ncbi:MAG TPA: VTT domain-containing protein [Candidatus Binatia bacterium]|nr:VTT domain-containing protein [Candidatus Binatia bacterium]
MTHLQPLLDWLGAHPGLGLICVLLISLCDSLLVISIVVPAMPLMFGIGALTALDALAFWPCVAAVSAGAVAGDSISFWFGRRFGKEMFASRLAKRYPEMVARSERFFEQHGKKSIFIGRFVGLVRPFIPAIAAAHGMRWAVFVALDAFAGLCWALAYMTPGVVFGASLGLASEVAARLATLLLTLLVLVTALIWVADRVVRRAQRRAGRWIDAMLDWSARHRTVGRLGGWLADPAQPETPALAALALGLFAVGAFMLLVWWGVGQQVPPAADQLAWQLSQDLRTPVTTALAVAAGSLSNWKVYAPVAATVLLTLWLGGHVRAAAHWLAALGFGVMLSCGLRALVHVTDPAHFYHLPVAGHTAGFDLVIATAIYAFVPVLLTTQRPPAVRARYYGVAASLIVLMLLGELYLGGVWLSVGVTAVLFGTLWVAVLGVGYRRHGALPIAGRELLPAVIGVLVAATTLAGAFELQHDRSKTIAQMQRLPSAAWWNGRYAELPAYRMDNTGREKQPLTVQWAGELNDINGALHRAGWQEPPVLSWTTALRWLAPSAPLAELPLLPQAHAGAHQALMLRKPMGAVADGDYEQEAVIRLWPSGARIERLPLWIGTLSTQTGQRTLRLMRYPRTDRDFDLPLAALSPAPAGFEARRVQHRRREADVSLWTGGVWLLRPARAEAAPPAPAAPAAEPPAPSRP